MEEAYPFLYMTTALHYNELRIKYSKSGVPSLDESILGRLGRMMTGKTGRWVVIAVWIIAAIALTFTLPAVNDRTANNAADLPEDSPSVMADELIKEEFPKSSGLPALLTWHRESGLTEADLAEIQYLSKELTDNPLTQQSFYRRFMKFRCLLFKDRFQKMERLSYSRFSLKKRPRLKFSKKILKALMRKYRNALDLTHSRSRQIQMNYPFE